MFFLLFTISLSNFHTKVCYDANIRTASRHVHLPPHSDGCLISFNAPLNSRASYTGGGTRFLDTDETIHPPLGEALVHDAKRVHEGVKVVSGVRWLLVGFMDSKRSENDDLYVNKGQMDTDLVG